MKPFLLFLLCSLCVTVNAQYKNDNVLFKTVDPADLSAALKQNPGYLLLDVRTAGEHFDTSAMGMNIGHLKGAYNIDVRELPKRWSEISDYKDRPVFVYCSHSQRSRRASKMLADSGFTKVYNINGGMTSFHYLNVKNNAGIKDLFETHEAYTLISPQELCKEMNKPKTKVIDVRSDSAYQHIASNSKLNAVGILKRAEHISLDNFPSRVSALNKEQNIILTDVHGDEAVKAARILLQNDFKHVAVLLEGMDRWTLADPQTISCGNEYVSNAKFRIISAYELGRWKQSYIALDIRTNEEFTNNHKDSWRNIGTLRNAINIPFADLDEFSDQLRAYKNMPVVVYDFGGGGNAHAAAEKLSANGFKNVQVLAGGLFNLRWTSANMKGQKNLAKLVTGVPEINQ